jgi:hypothetical protein
MHFPQDSYLTRGFPRRHPQSIGRWAAERDRKRAQAIAAARARPRPTEPPIVYAQPHWMPGRPGTAVWRWRCEYCKRWHNHAPSPGLRESHCVEPASPLFEVVYDLQLAAGS